MLIIDLVLGAVTSSDPAGYPVGRGLGNALIAVSRNVICYSFSVEGVELRGPCWRNNQRNAGNCNFQNKIWYRSGPGGTELVVPKLYWWWSRTRHRVSCGTEMDRYRNRSPRRPEMVVVGLVIKYFSESILRPLSCCAQGQLPPSAPRSLRHCYFPPFYEFKLLKLLDSRY